MGDVKNYPTLTLVDLHTGELLEKGCTTYVESHFFKNNFPWSNAGTQRQKLTYKGRTNSPMLIAIAPQRKFLNSAFDAIAPVEAEKPTVLATQFMKLDYFVCTGAGHAKDLRSKLQLGKNFSGVFIWDGGLQVYPSSMTRPSDITESRVRSFAQRYLDEDSRKSMTVKKVPPPPQQQPAHQHGGHGHVHGANC